MIFATHSQLFAAFEELIRFPTVHPTHYVTLDVSNVQYFYGFYDVFQVFSSLFSYSEEGGLTEGEVSVGICKGRILIGRILTNL